MKRAMLYEKMGTIVRCKTCSHRCAIPEGKTGICGVRKNISGNLHLLVYGVASSSNVDPIEKKPLFHFLPGTEVFSFGTVSCNFQCKFCQNWEMSQALRIDKENKVETGEKLPPEKIVDFAVKHRIPSIAYTYNEPAIFFEYAYDTAKLAHSKGIKNVFVSNGYETEEALKEIRPYLDGINIDLKSFSEEFYKNVCAARLQPVLDTIMLAHELGIWTEITTLLIPGKNDSPEELRKMAGFIADTDKAMPWHISRFFPMFKMTDIKATPIEKLELARNTGIKAGLEYVYVGNVPHRDYENT